MSARVLERARADLGAGRSWKARDRLEGALANEPTDSQVLELLGEICFGMGDLPAAGAYWFLTDRQGDDVVAADRALRERHPTASALFAALPLKTPVEKYPPAVRRRLEDLLADERTRWAFEKKRRGIGRKGRDPRTAGEYDGDTLGTVLGVSLLALFLAPWVIGLVTLVVLALRVF